MPLASYQHTEPSRREASKLPYSPFGSVTSSSSFAASGSP